MSSFYIYNAARERIGILQHEDSVQWLENYQSPGEVKIEARATPDNLAMLIDGNRIYNHDSDTVARICERDIVDEDSEATITVRADITSELLSDRVIMATENIKGSESGMYSIYRKNRRELPIEIAEPEGYDEQAEMQVTWNSVLEAEEKIAGLSGLGFKVIFDPETGAETFKVYKGVDRSDYTSDGYVGYFGTDVNNIKNISVSEGTSNYKNVAVVAGEGEGTERAVRIVELGDFTGEHRREMYVDARDLQREYQVATEEIDEEGNLVYQYETREYSDADYGTMLEARGLEKLAEQLRDFSLLCDIEQNNIRFGEDYFLGDRMPVKLPEYGIFVSARVSTANRVYEKEGNIIVALLSDFELLEITGGAI